MAGFDKSFDTSARKFLLNPAIIYVNNNKKYDKITYKQLMQQVLQLTQCLIKYLSRNQSVGIALSCNLHLPALILSVHKLESAFYCFDSVSINISVLNSIGIKYIITSNIAHHSLDSICIKLDQIENFIFWEIKNVKPIVYNNISYVVQTSGTTGENKIVKVTHECINSNIESLKEIFQINEQDVIFFGTPITFDPFIIEIMLALSSGAALLIVDEEIKNNKPVLLNILSESDVTVLQSVPSLFLGFPDKYIKLILTGQTNIRLLALGGEKFPENLFNYPGKKIKLFNLYGITEVSCWASAEEINTLPVSLGKPFKDTIFQIRDENNKILENGEGHLYIGSKSRVCFINNENVQNEIFRPTGDVVKYDQISNKFYYICRKNDVIKRFGIKINLNEINKIIYEITQLISISVWDETNYKLILFIILQENDTLVKNKIIDKLRIKLIQHLPKQYNPDFIEIIPSFPVTSNGKLDRETLLKISQISNIVSKNPKEFFEYLYSKYFGLSKYQININKNKSFGEIGGNSIIAIQLVSEFDENFTSNSAELIAALLDPNQCYLNYISLIEESLELEPKPKHSKLNNKEEKLLNKNDLRLKISWKYDLKACVDCTALVFYHSSLGTLIASGSHANIFAIININGKLVSQSLFQDAVEATACLTLCKNFVIVGCNDGYIYCIEIITGNILWKFLCGNSVKTTCILYENKRIIFGSYDKHLYCLNVKDGTISWKLHLNESIKSNVIVFKDNCYVATIHGTYYCISVRTTNINWKITSNNPVFSSACILEKYNIILWADVKGYINSFDINNGTKVWEINTSNSIYSSVVNKNERILFNCLDHNVYCYEVTRHEYSLIFKINLGAQISSTPCIFVLNNMWYFTVVNNKGIVYLFEFNTGILRQKYELSNEVFSSPVVHENCIFVGCRDNNLYCIEINN